MGSEAVEVGDPPPQAERMMKIKGTVKLMIRARCFKSHLVEDLGYTGL